MNKLKDFLFFSRTKTCLALEKTLDAASTETNQKLIDAMKYAVLSEGKFIRPALVYATAQLFSDNTPLCTPAASAIECIHAYSLIHDDLPAMDDDSLRRGKPTCHIAYNEWLAILAGDALQALAFELIADYPTFVKILATAAGPKGMVAGQAYDMYSEGQYLSLSALQNMHALKTGALLEAAVLLGAHAASNNLSQLQIQSLSTFGQAIGTAFQIHDDILDVVGNTAQLGKNSNQDNAHNKSTYPSLLGLDEAKKEAAYWYDKAITALSDFPDSDKKDLLLSLASYIIQRSY